MALFCIDIGNTHTHFGIVTDTQTLGQSSIPTPLVDRLADGIVPAFGKLVTQHGRVDGIAMCSVVPLATPLVVRAFELQNIQIPIFRLTHQSRLGLPIHYPNPSEIGHDRLANAIGAWSREQAPTVVIDMGTAVTFDVVTRANGYEGGIIAPGIEIMRSYLHEKTAQLPKLDERLDLSGPIGRSTLEAMRIGTVIGFAGMIQSLLDAVLKHLEERGERGIRIYTTGGSAAAISQRIVPLPVHVPELTLQGLAAAFRSNRA